MDADRGIARWEDGLRWASRALASRVGQLARGPAARRACILTARHPGRAVILLGTVGWLLGLVGAEGRPKATAPAPIPAALARPDIRPPERAVVPPEYVVLAGRLADEWRTSRDGPEQSIGDTAELAALRGAALDLSPLKPADPDLAAAVSQARGLFDEMAASYERFLALPRPPGVLDSAAESFVRGLLFDFGGATRQHDQLVGIRDGLLSEVRGLAALIRRAEVAKLMLPRIATRHAGPPRAGGPALAVDLDAAWGPVGPADWLTLTNSSGSNLHNATVLVEIRGEGGDVAPSVHFIPSWPAGTAIQARYGQGDLIFGYASNRQTVPDVVGVAASIWSEELRQEGIAYAYAGAERDADVARYCSGMRVQASYRPFRRGVLRNTERGMELRLDGIESLPGPRILASFRGAGVKELHWNFPRWDRGECKVLDSGGALAWDPDEVVIEISFPDTGYKYEARWPGP